MTIAALTWAFSVTAKPGPKIVLLALADNADDKWFSFPSVRTLAARASMSERAVQVHLKELVRLGVIRIEQRLRKDGSMTSNGYYLLHDAAGNTPARFAEGGAESAEGGANAAPSPQDVGSTPRRQTQEGAQNLRRGVKTSAPHEPSLEDTIPPSPSGIAPQGAETRDRKSDKGKVRATRLAADWTLPDDWRADAETIGLLPAEIAVEAERFRDYWHGAAGQRATKADWRATWCNWVRKAVADRKRTPRLLTAGGIGGQAIERERVPDHPVLKSLAGMIGSPAVRSWFRDAQFDCHDTVLIIRFSTKLMRDYVKNHFQQQVEAAAARHGYASVGYDLKLERKGQAA